MENAGCCCRTRVGTLYFTPDLLFVYCNHRAEQSPGSARASGARRRPPRGQCNAQRPRWLDGSVDCRPLVLDAVGGEEASRFLSSFWVGAPARGSAHGRPSGAHGVRRACCLLKCGGAYTSTGLSWKCNETFFTAMFKIQTPDPQPRAQNWSQARPVRQ